MDNTDIVIQGVEGQEGPNLEVRNSPNNKWDGLYEYKTRGSIGEIYVNEEKDILIKINTAVHHTPQEPEVEKQLSVGELAPTIYWHQGDYTIYMKDTENILTYDTNPPYEHIGVIIMEYLNPDFWRPVTTGNMDRDHFWALLDGLYNLIFNYELINNSDMVGFSGPHIYITKEPPYRVKFLDYEKYQRVKVKKENEKEFFMDFCNELSRMFGNSLLFSVTIGEYAVTKWPVPVPATVFVPVSVPPKKSVRRKKSSITSRKPRFPGVCVPESTASKKKKHTKRKKKRKSKKSKMR